MSLEREQSDPLPGLLSGLKQKHPNRERESGKRGVRFPLFRSSSRLWEWGNASLAISKGCGRGGKPAFGFPPRPWPVISTVVFHAVLFWRRFANNSRFACCIFRAACVSLLARARCSKLSMVISGLR